MGLHTMWNEHFGIGVVEMMAAGLVTVAHNSGGPKTDIIVPLEVEEENSTRVEAKQTGFLASTVDEYAEAMNAILCGGNGDKNGEDVLGIRRCGRQQATKFSDEAFVELFKMTFISSSILR